MKIDGILSPEGLEATVEFFPAIAMHDEAYHCFHVMQHISLAKVWREGIDKIGLAS